MGRLLLGLSTLLCAMIPSPALALQSDDIVGFWITGGGHARVEIFKNEKGYSAKIVGLGKPNYGPAEVKGMGGKARVDLNNPDSSLRQRSLMGLEIMSGFTFENGKWVGGRIYDPENGKNYKCTISLEEDGTLKVRGYVGVSLLGRTSTWEPADEYLRRVLRMFDLDESRDVRAFDP